MKTKSFFRPRKKPVLGPYLKAGLLCDKTNNLATTIEQKHVRDEINIANGEGDKNNAPDVFTERNQRVAFSSIV